MYPRWLPPLLAACMVVSGACGLVYEVVWARLLGVFLGASAHAHAIVLAGFLGGLALGNAVLGRLVDRHPTRSLALYAVLEVAIGVYGLLSPELRLLVADLYYALVGDAPPGSLTIGAKFLASAIFVIVPTFAMGGTLPALTRFVVRRLDDVGRTVARLYLVNTAGAALGAFCAGMVLVPQIGTVNALRLAGVANLVVAAVAGIAWAIVRVPAGLEEDDEDERVDGEDDDRDPDAADATVHPTSAPPRMDGRDRALLGAAFSVGIATLTIEVVWTRLFSMVFGSSAQAFTLMLTTFIVGIAVGSLGAPGLLRRYRGSERRLFATLLAIAAVVLVVQIPLYEHLPYWQFRIAQALERRPHVYPLYLTAQSTMAFLWMLPLTIITGSALPVAAAAFTTRFDRVGARVGLLFTANTLGNVVGPLLATFVLFPLVGLRYTVTAAVVALSVAAVLAARSVDGDEAGDEDRARLSRRIVGVAAVLVLASVVLPRWDGGVLHSGGFRRWTLEAGASYREFQESRARSTTLWEADGPTDSVIVLENRDGLRFMKVNGKTDASDAEDLPTQRMVAHIPLLLHRAWQGEAGGDVFVVGLGSGVTVGSAALHEGVDVTSAELSEGVIAASRFFDHVNHDVRTRENVTLHRADAREWLERSKERWDVIINQPSNPWIAGNAALFSREFFVAARERLAEGGVFAQWMHVYAMDDATVQVVMDTFASVFPNVTVWWPQGVDLLLIGTMEPLVPDLDELAAGLAQPWLQAEMDEYDREGLRIDTVERLLALQIQSEEGFAASFTGGLPHTTDVRPVLEFRAPVAQFVGARSELFVAMDERLRPSPIGASRLHLGRLDPSERDAADLLAFFSSRETPFSSRLAGSLQHEVTGRSPGPADYPGITTRATGLPVVFESWTAAMLGEDAPSTEDCRVYLDTAQSTLPVRATVFHRPDLSKVRAVVDRCVGPLAPGVAGFLRAMEAELLVSCGYHDEGVALAEQLLASPQPEAVVEAMEALVSRER